MAIASPIREGRHDDGSDACGSSVVTRTTDARVTIDDLWQHRDFLHALSRRIVGDSATADDVVQETFVRALHRLDNLDPNQSVRAWLAIVARRCSIDELRRQARHARPTDELPEEPTHGANGALDEVLARHEMEATRDALEGLHARERRLLLAQVTEGRSIADLAAEDGSTPRAVESVLSRARTKLASAVDRGAFVVAPLAQLVRWARRRAVMHAPGLNSVDESAVAMSHRTYELVAAGVAVAVLASAFVVGGRGASDTSRVEMHNDAQTFVPGFSTATADPVSVSSPAGAARTPQAPATALGEISGVDREDAPPTGNLWLALTDRHSPGGGDRGAATGRAERSPTGGSGSPGPGPAKPQGSADPDPDPKLRIGTKTPRPSSPQAPKLPSGPSGPAARQGQSSAPSVPMGTLHVDQPDAPDFARPAAAPSPSTSTSTSTTTTTIPRPPGPPGGGTGPGRVPCPQQNLVCTGAPGAMVVK